MTVIFTDRKVVKNILKLSPKHQEQVRKKILDLADNPIPLDSFLLKDYAPYRRCDCGEYRIIYFFDVNKDAVIVRLVGKRNGGEVYKRFKNMDA